MTQSVLERLITMGILGLATFLVGFDQIPWQQLSRRHVKL